ncbi:UDP-glucose/GDP-mannose dehydrogenase family protein [Clostridium sp. OS1-26]|uniref:UDP-glucose dehydrogenase family protein n=1 Tax=Clostridium sp. OS1-26 TaxID=3070681 RepID=UPI0027E0024B|nr:UDP-glucose/GDP-mannose dehydrogenase family protein [Clostridium sp. OS1-26]WML35838.1 UDP-glucose/GDP-mannose dehydrogenase family protein [Clostridium sp. OS1-26]
MRISIVGTGYVGLVAGACLADNGNNVICIDIDKEKIEILRNGNISIYEPGLNEMVLNNVDNGNLQFTTNIKSAVENSDIIFIAVGTPPSDDGSPDLKYVVSVARDIGKYMNEYKVIVNKSTVPVGTSDNISQIIENELRKRNIVIDFNVVSNPEFLREGNGIKDFMEPDRVIIGCDNDKAKDIMEKLYLSIVPQDKIIYMSNKAAEMTKYASNAMLATRISFINDISNLCDILGVNIEEVKNGMGRDKRIGDLFLNSGIGYGGSCFPKDIKALIGMANKNKYNMLLLKAVEEVNKNQKRFLSKK